MSMITDPSDYEWYPQEYKKDIYKRLKSLENNRAVFRKNSPEFEYRGSLIQWLRKVFKDVDFCRVTLHLAVYLLDHFMDTHTINPDKLTLVAMLCFTLAGKFAEREVNVPKISEINDFLVDAYTKEEIISFECIILKRFNWQLTMPTTLHFAEYFMEYAVAPQDICHNCSNFQVVYKIIRSSVSDYLDIILEDDDLIEEPPSLVAASSIFAVRKSFKMNPTWPRKLEHVSQYSEEDLEDCVSRIIKFKESYQQQRKRKLDRSPDHGYETENSSPCSLKSRRETVDDE